MKQKNFRLPDDVINIMKVKAAVYTGGKLSAFLRKAVEAYQEPLPGGPCLCGRTTDQVLAETVAWPKTTFTNVPVYRCKTCGRAGVDFEVMKIIEHYADRGESLDFATILHPKESSANGAPTDADPAEA